MKKDNQQKGIGLIEVIVAIAIIIITLFGFLELARYTLIIQEQSEAKIEAINLATEAIEATRSSRDENWDNLASLSIGTRYYPVISENKWTLDSTNPGPINEIYERWIILETVYRDTNDDISASGTEDSQTKKVIAMVEWNDRGKIRQIQLTTYLTSWPN